ncbi:sulfite exporter TauE/SafE family protein [Salidesulfovibrio onnuriiensis]|uniref:urease accessory protein UreH domain-containing protein n=1 Tax=Salidesulfovibrio onnuriiensis TaxID=2583823 RepID=UPI0011C8BDE7|nr:sulfite exporter TauE/SafE family protein [Salidesulfovibrio onnuriiensis]
MNFDTLFLVALQSSLMLGFIHGVNPCGHSWVVLAPFVAGDSSGKRVSVLTTAFIFGTTMGCLGIGLALGLLSAGLPESVRSVTDMITGGIIVLLGAVLLWRPHLLHSHDHDGHHCHEHGHDHDHGDHCSCHSHAHTPLSARRSTAWGLGTLGFVNMIVPCPTVAIMYSYALESGSAAKSVAVFGIYALGTGVALGGVIYAIFKVTSLIRRMQQSWIEPAVMRTVGVMTIAFGVYSLYGDFAA